MKQDLVVFELLAVVAVVVFETNVRTLDGSFLISIRQGPKSRPSINRTG